MRGGLKPENIRWHILALLFLATVINFVDRQTLSIIAPVLTEEFQMTGEDLLARAFLHETEHLFGRLYITHISALKRDLMKRKIKKLQRSGEWE